jgi:CheY-like chemotaxis protein
MKTVLLVEDDPETLDGLRTLLELNGFATATALHGEEALQVVSSSRPDIVITDWHMPYVDGIQLCEILRRGALTRPIPLVMISGEVPGFLDHSFDAFLLKPVCTDELLLLIHQLLDAQACISTR